LRPYFPFEKTGVKEASNTQRTPYLFTGKELDEETGLCYFGARHHDPRTDAFLSTDPLLVSRPQKATTVAAFLSPQAYVLNNRLRLVDPTGRSVVSSGFQHDADDLARTSRRPVTANTPSSRPFASRGQCSPTKRRRAPLLGGWSANRSSTALAASVRPP